VVPRGPAGQARTAGAHEECRKMNVAWLNAVCGSEGLYIRLLRRVRKIAKGDN
jgi:hypothetical protein